MWEFSADGWSSGPVRVAVGPLERARGLIPSGDHGLLIRARSVHGLGMTHPLVIVGLAAGLTTSVGLLPPAGVIVDRLATAIMELPPWRDPPPLGVTVTARRIR